MTELPISQKLDLESAPLRPAKPASRKQFAGLGIDLLRVGRVRRFLRQYGPQVFQKILTPLEREWVCGRRSNVMEFARRFCAKEAYFKTLDEPWLGVEGLQKIHVEAMTKHTFSVCWLNEKGEPSRRASGCFFQGPQWVAAQVIRWS